MRPHAARPTLAFLVLTLLGNACARDEATGVSASSASADEPIDIAITPSSVTLALQETQQFTASVRTEGGRTIERAPVTWTSTDESVASVSESGLATAHGMGVAYIRAAFAGVRDSARVVVEDAALRDVIVYATEEFGISELAVVHADGSGRRRLTTDRLGYFAPDISPDGRQIAFASLRSGVWAIYLMNADATGVRVLVQRSTFDGSPAWSPDGSRIAFRSHNDGPFGAYGRIFIINVDGTGLRQLSPENANPNDYTYDEGPTWSRDGSQIVFTRNGALHVINADGTGFAPLPNEDMSGYPDWSPDGTRIAYGSLLGGMDIAIRNADGSNPIRVTSAPEQENNPRWSPDSRRLVFSGGGRVFSTVHYRRGWQRRGQTER